MVAKFVTHLHISSPFVAELTTARLYSRAFGRMGSAYQKKNDLDSAIKYYNKALTEHRTADVLEKLRVAEKTKKDNDVAAYLSPEKAEEARNEGNDLFKVGDVPIAVQS